MRLRVPSPATVVAGIALFLAGGGSVFAAGHYLITSTHQIKPSVLRALHGRRGPAGRQGLQGPQGLQGVPGQRGKRGYTGKTGATGAVGPKGDTGPVTDVLPSGLTETGWFAVSSQHVTAGDVATTAISFTFRLAAVPTVNYVAPGGQSTPTCPGSYTDPRAAPGNLCVYVHTATNLATAGVYAPAGVDARDGDHDQTAARAGAVLSVSALADGVLTAADGAWAVTAA